MADAIRLTAEISTHALREEGDFWTASKKS